MFEFVKGLLKSRLPHKVVLENGGIGWEIFASLNTYRELADSQDSEITLLTHLHWREDGPQLFGFIREEERTLFRLLNRVSKVGPKLAINVLSAATPEKLVEMILSEDTRSLTSLKGIGPKLASRLIVELKEPLSNSGFGNVQSSLANKKTERKIPFEKEVREALENLGYSSREIDKALIEVAPEIQPSLEIEEVIEKILHYFSR
ncbi:MAG: Holliday junction branch migration protein RuvA [Candidatus Riflebacteria bacterium]|nr:Holliday junction branch migration protein RuvA [Candidatus Riflebacteria bacterium]